MADRFIVGVPLGRWQTNCYLVGDHDRGECVVVDPGEYGLERVPSLLEDLGVECQAILLTHGHLDHFWAAPALGRKLAVPIHLHPGDRWLWDNPLAGFADGLPVEALEAQFGLRWEPDDDRLRDLEDGEKLRVAGLEFVVAHTPGHTPGHVTFLGRGLDGAAVRFDLGAPSPGDEVLFSGDLIFAGSVGRTDFPRGDTDALLRSLVESLAPLDDTTVILSGHGADTTVGRERALNPFVAEARRRYG